MKSKAALKWCSNGPDCVHQEGPLLPETKDYFRERKKGSGKFRSRCIECERAYDRDRDSTETRRFYNRKKNRRLYEKKKARYNEYCKEWRSNNKEKMREYFRERRRKTPNKSMSVVHVNKMILRGEFPPVSECKCQHCGAQAQHYHHWSYKREHWLDVIPLCIPCHRKVHRKS